MFGFFKKKRSHQPEGPNPQAPVVPGGQFGPPPGGPTAGMQSNANELPGAWPLGIPNNPGRGLLAQTGQYQPLPMSAAAQVQASSKTRYRPFSGHSFIQARLPDPGAPQYTFDALGLVEFSPIGAGVMNQGEILACEGAPYFPNLMVPMQGLGGIVQGEIVLQPLMADPLSTAELQV